MQRDCTRICTIKRGLALLNIIETFGKGYHHRISLVVFCNGQQLVRPLHIISNDIGYIFKTYFKFETCYKFIAGFITLVSNSSLVENEKDINDTLKRIKHSVGSKNFKKQKKRLINAVMVLWSKVYGKVLLTYWFQF